MADTSSLTIKQHKFLKLYLDCGNATEAAMQVYDCATRESAHAIGSENLRKLTYSDLMEEAGITDKVLQDKILEGLDATRTISAIKGTKANGTDTDFIDVPDFMARHKYLETALKLKQRLNDKDDRQGDTTVNILVQVYGHNDPLQLQSGRTEPASDPRFIASGKVSSLELAQKSPQDNAGSESTNKVGGDI